MFIKFLASTESTADFHHIILIFMLIIKIASSSFVYNDLRSKYSNISETIYYDNVETEAGFSAYLRMRI